MPMQTWQGVLISSQVDGAALATSTSEVSLLPGQAKFVLPANTLTYAGQALRVRAMGRISNIVTTPGTLTFRFKLGPTSNIAVATSGAFALNTTAKTNVTWILDWDLTARTIGASTTATLMHSGQWHSESVIGSPAAGAGGPGSHIIPTSAPAVGTGFDSTVANICDLTAQWSVSNAANSITCHTYKLESIN